MILMELIQNLLVLVGFLFALAYLITKFIWKPAFLQKKTNTGCGSSNCGCH